jgi:hypothetical protein
MQHLLRDNVVQMRDGATYGMLSITANWEGPMTLPRISLSLAALIAANAAHAQAAAPGLPDWKIAEICARESAPGQCAAFEGRALKAVSASWSFVLEPIRKSCLDQAKNQLDQSWRLLAECLDKESLRALDKSAVSTARTPAEPVPPPKPAMEAPKPESPPVAPTSPQ